MKVLCLNLPYKQSIVRRYTCSYYAPNFLLPPLELTYIAACIRQQKDCQVFLWDAIALGLSIDYIQKSIGREDVDVIVSLLGLETFDDDVAMIQSIKNRHPGLKIICCGFWPTQYPREILEHVPEMDYLVLGEPERASAQLCAALQSKTDTSALPQTAQRIGRQVVVGATDRMMSIDRLPFPARDLIPTKPYFEFFSPRPFVTMLTSRGCASGCHFCIPTYGRRVCSRTQTNIFQEIDEVVEQGGVKMIRFMDDDFCYDRNRVASFCLEMREKPYRVAWSCLTRPDRLDEKMIKGMKAAGCSRVYLGIETFSPKLQERYNKVFDQERCIKNIYTLKEQGIEVSCFFLLSAWQTQDEFEKDVHLACALPIDYIVVSQLKVYPGTAMFERFSDDVCFCLFPYQHQLKDQRKEEQLLRWEKEFYRRFYARIGLIGRMGKRVCFYPKDLWQGTINFLRYMIQARDQSSRREMFTIK
ncbi:MAG: B12-binding domain-containing radical SAM protein [Candidatus Omnitrophica bacterium]|nr:B12-binding domain-containing radical SAM protein [Candidatus Omnitrophota bacterium]